MPDFSAFITYVLLATFTPGPNNLMAMANATRHGFRKTLRFTAGVTLGFFVLLALCFAFSAALFALVPTLHPVMAGLGAAYMLWLAWKTLRSKPHEDGTEDSRTYGFWSGAALQFVNPKAILYGVTTASSFVVPYFHGPVVLGAIAVLLALVAFVATSSWALFGAAFQRFFAKQGRVVNVVMALLLVYCAVSLFL
jgi:threonine/homoserine/homoserine lactone efflux protein